MLLILALVVLSASCFAQPLPSEKAASALQAAPVPSPDLVERIRLEQEHLALQRERIEFERNKKDGGSVTPLVVGLLGGSITAIGWLVSYLLNSRTSRRTLAEAASLKYLELQLEELYGPLAFLVLEGRQTFRELLDSLGRNHVFQAGRELPPDELKTWLFWVENDFFPRNEKIKTLLSSKTHLLEGLQIPKSYQEFLDHHNSWYINHLRWKQDSIPYSWHSKVNWPAEFESEVMTTFSEIKARHIALIKQRPN